MWNSLELECPASDLVAYPPPDHYILENLRDFVTVLTTSADTLTSESPLWNEMKVLQNIQAKYKRILRCDRFLIFLQRVGHCLRKMVLLNLSKSYLDLAERFLVGFQDLSGTPKLPSRQQVEYILIRTLSTSKLVCEAINYSRESFCYIIQKLKVGHLILDLIMATSIIARLNILLRATLEQLSSMYKQVLFWRYKVKKGQFQWAEKFDFPQDIEEWVKSSEPAYLKPLDMSKEDMDRIKSMLKQSNVITSKTKESDNESVVLVSDEDVPVNEITVVSTDFGEIVARKIDEVKVQKKVNTVGNVNMNKSSVKKKKIRIRIDDNLTKVQKSTLQKVIQIQSLKHLEDLWYDIVSSCQEAFPARLTARKKEKISTLFSEIRTTYPQKVYYKIYETKPQFLQKAILHVCKKLGYSDDHIGACKKALDPELVLELDSSDEVPQEEKSLNASVRLTPVKNVANLRILYDQLKEILKFKNESVKLKSLKTIFKHRMADIKHLKQQGKRDLAKRLISCTSKEFLALYQ